DRPPLSKKLWAGKPLESIFRKTKEAGVELHLETRVVSGAPAARTVMDDRGGVYGYEKLLLATGGIPRRLPFTDSGVIYFRTLEAYRRLRSLADRKASVVVVGGGFVGSEIAAALAMHGCAVSMIFPGAGIGASIYPPGLTAFLNTYYQD